MLMIDRATENIASLYAGITGKPLSSLTVADCMLLREEAVAEVEKGLFTVDNGCHSSEPIRGMEIPARERVTQTKRGENIATNPPAGKKAENTVNNRPPLKTETKPKVERKEEHKNTHTEKTGKDSGSRQNMLAMMQSIQG